MATSNPTDQDGRQRHASFDGRVWTTEAVRNLDMTTDVETAA
jgi:hypothetical protein